MISDTLTHTYIDQGRKFYAFFMNFKEERDGRIVKGFHFFCFDQLGYVWFHEFNATLQAVRAFSDGIFLRRPAWEADGNVLYEPLEQDKWLPDSGVDAAYALETVRQLTGLDMMLVCRGENSNKENYGETNENETET